MKAASLLTALLFRWAVADKPDYDAMWKKFKITYHKYDQANDYDEKLRFNVFKANVDIIVAHNEKNLSYTLGVNEYADLTWEEFSKTHLGFHKGAKLKALSTTPANVSVADSIDWVAKGAVTDVKNQMQCGSCWAFSATGSVEGALQIATGRLVSISEQDLVSCDDGSEGCKGGGMDDAFGWIEKHGICTEDDYPYTSGAGVTGTCKTTCKPEVTLTGFTDVPKGDESALQKAVNLGPVSIAIEADKSAFQLYSGGVLDSASCGKELDHGVLIVGYGTDSGKDYWKVKNSWGANWGEDGYIRMVRNKDMCGLADEASYPTGVKFMGPLPPTPAPTPPPPPPPPPGPPPSPATGCKFPQVQACYTASLQTCWTPFQKKNQLTSAALDSLQDQTTAAGIKKNLIGGSEWKDVWSVQTKGEYAYLTAYKFQTYDFLQSYQFAQATLQLMGSKDTHALDAFNKLTDQFDGTFYSKHGCGVNNTASTASEPIVVV
jgi:C1A family cysteine protease